MTVVHAMIQQRKSVILCRLVLITENSRYFHIRAYLGYHVNTAQVQCTHKHNVMMTYDQPACMLCWWLTTIHCCFLVMLGATIEVNVWNQEYINMWCTLLTLRSLTLGDALKAGAVSVSLKSNQFYSHIYKKKNNSATWSLARMYIQCYCALIFIPLCRKRPGETHRRSSTHTARDWSDPVACSPGCHSQHQRSRHFHLLPRTPHKPPVISNRCQSFGVG